MKKTQFLFFFLSFLIVALAQPDWSPFACVLCSSIGYALFWKGMLYSSQRKMRFFQATLWFAAVQAVQVSWFATDRYVGGVIFVFLALLFLALGAQFGLISLFIKENPSIFRILGICGGWVLLEWSRLFILSGYSWNPSGLALSGTLYGMQIASAIGVFGMGFWIFFTNLLGLKIFTTFSTSRLSLWGAVAVAPYLLGGGHLVFHQKKMIDHDDHLSALTIQTSLYPEEKLPFNGSIPLSPYNQWERILNLLHSYVDSHPDLIVFPETTVPYGADYPIYRHDVVAESFRSIFGKGTLLPPSFAEHVGNTYWARAIANQFGSDVIIGLEDYKHGENGEIVQAFNAAFLLRPHNDQKFRYEKRVLVPMGEYIPFNWCRQFLAKYGIKDSFTPGKEAKVFHTSRVPVGLSICYEETYGHLMRESRLKGAALLINLSNDVWYPRSRLPMVHFFHGRLRAVEAGIPLVRSCNTGVTCGVDSLGRIVGMLPYECANHFCPAEVLSLSLPLYHYPTFYILFGDTPIVLSSSFLFCFMCIGILLKTRLTQKIGLRETNC